MESVFAPGSARIRLIHLVADSEHYSRIRPTCGIRSAGAAWLCRLGRLTSGDATRVCDTTSGGRITHRSACTRLRVEVNTSASSRGRLSTRVKFRRLVGDKTPPNLFRPLGVRFSFSLLGWPAVVPLGVAEQEHA